MTPSELYQKLLKNAKNTISLKHIHQTWFPKKIIYSKIFTVSELSDDNFLFKKILTNISKLLQITATDFNKITCVVTLTCYCLEETRLPQQG